MYMTEDVVRCTIEIMDEYIQTKNSDFHNERMDPEQFLTEIFGKRLFDDETKDAITELFFKVLKYEKLLNDVLTEYYKSQNRRVPTKPNDYCLCLVFLYTAIFELNAETVTRMREIMMTVNMGKAIAIAKFLKMSNFTSLLFSLAVKIWDIDYVRQTLLSSIQESVFQELYKGLQETIIARKRSKEKVLTKPIEMQVLKRSRRKPEVGEQPVVCGPDRGSELLQPSSNQGTIKATPIPRTTYTEPHYQKRLEEDQIKNKEKARELYEEAQKFAFRVASLPKPKKEQETEINEKMVAPTKPSKIPMRREPLIQPKKTAAVILREGARLLKMEQDEIKRLEEIMKGAFSSESLKVLEREIQEERMRKHVEEIEKKHLQGLLTYEESLIAKQKYLKKMKEGADEFRKEKETWMKQLESWRAEEQIRIRESVEKGKAYERGAKEAVEHVKEEKHKMALETMEESKSLKEKWLTEREEELKRKIQLIKEIKALQAFGIIRRKEAVANAVVSVGLLCEMSTEELRERLMLLRMEVREEINRRRKEIRQKKECRRAILNSYENLIQQHQEIRKEKMKTEQREKKEVSVIKSSSVEALKKKLDEKRKERMHYMT